MELVVLVFLILGIFLIIIGGIMILRVIRGFKTGSFLSFHYKNTPFNYHSKKVRLKLSEDVSQDSFLPADYGKQIMNSINNQSEIKCNKKYFNYVLWGEVLRAGLFIFIGAFLIIRSIWFG